MDKLTEPKKELDGEALLRLDNQLCFALYAATRAITKTYRERLDSFGLTYPQYLVLLVLWEQDGITISEIGDRLMLDSGTLTPLVKRLASMEVVRRQRDDRDERVVRVFVTDKGRGLKEKALEARKHVACRLDMSEQQILDMRADLMAMLNQLNR